MLEDPRFVLRFMAAAAAAGLRSSVLREAPSRDPER
jgi:50S ribosomal protein L16 3-hydroxylase